MKIISPLFLALLVSACASTPSITKTQNSLADTPDELMQFCETAPCRKNTSFKLKKEDGNYFEYESALDPPVIQTSYISIYPSEIIYVEAELINGKLQNFKHVENISDASRTITFGFSQKEDMANGTDMMLVVRNPFDKPLRYNLGMMPLSEESLFKTSSCPVMAGGSVYEHWPYPIFQLFFANIRLLEEGDSFGCVE